MRQQAERHVAELSNLREQIQVVNVLIGDVIDYI